MTKSLLALTEREARYDEYEKRLARGLVIAVPTITLEGDANGAPHLDASAYAKKFSGKYSHRAVTGGLGHNLPQEAPKAFAQAVIDVSTYRSTRVWIQGPPECVRGHQGNSCVSQVKMPMSPLARSS